MMQASDLIRMIKSVPTCRPRFHGNGFVQLPISQMARVHFWSPILPPILDHNATIHDHVWDMTSDVLYGSIQHLTYELRMPEPTGIQYDIYSAGEQGKPGLGPLLATGAGLLCSGRYMMLQGSRYTFAANKLHETLGNTAVTLMQKSPHGVPYEQRPRILCTAGETPTDAFADRYMPADEVMWDVMEFLLRETPQDGLDKIGRVFDRRAIR